MLICRPTEQSPRNGATSIKRKLGLLSQIFLRRLASACFGLGAMLCYSAICMFFNVLYSAGVRFYLPHLCLSPRRTCLIPIGCRWNKRRWRGCKGGPPRNFVQWVLSSDCQPSDLGRSHYRIFYQKWVSGRRCLVLSRGKWWSKGISGQTSPESPSTLLRIARGVF